MNELVSFFGLVVWLVPFMFMISLSANDLAIPLGNMPFNRRSTRQEQAFKFLGGSPTKVEKRTKGSLAHLNKLSKCTYRGEIIRIKMKRHISRLFYFLFNSNVTLAIVEVVVDVLSHYSIVLYLVNLVNLRVPLIKPESHKVLSLYDSKGYIV